MGATDQQPKRRMSEIIYDKKDQMQRVMNHVVPGETLYAVYDMKGVGAGFGSPQLVL